MQVWDIMEEISEKELLPQKYRDVFRKDFRLTEYSIGEVLSELMAKYMKLPLFTGLQAVTIICIDNMDDYNDGSIKEYRLQKIEECVEEHPGSTWHFIKGSIADKALIRCCTVSA